MALAGKLLVHLLQYAQNYRLVVKMNYPYRVVYVRFVGTHVEYDAINAEEV